MTPNLFRREYARIVSALVRRYGAHRLSDIEDCVQFAMTQAVSRWRKEEIPAQPGAWLFTVANRKLIDQLRRDQRFEHDADAVVDIAQDTCDQAPRLKQELQSDLLQLLFVCCDPELAPQTQMVLALKTLCGFSTQEIALRLFLKPPAVQKRLHRGRLALKTRWSQAPASNPRVWQDYGSTMLAERHDAVLRVIYLLFNEGYASIRQDTPILRELCDEALYLGHTLLEHPDGQSAQAQALVALMLFHRARFDARIDGDGEVVLLEAQDRSAWDHAMIQAGLVHFTRATQEDVFSRYHAEAAIALQHSIAPTYQETNWREIADLYALLARLLRSPIYTLNQAIAWSQVEGPQAGIELIQDTIPSNWLSNYYLWDAAIGEMHRRAGNLSAARTHLETALAQAPKGWEQRLIAARLRAIDL